MVNDIQLHAVSEAQYAMLSEQVCGMPELGRRFRSTLKRSDFKEWLQSFYGRITCIGGGYCLKFRSDTNKAFSLTLRKTRSKNLKVKNIWYISRINSGGTAPQSNLSLPSTFLPNELNIGAENDTENDNSDSDSGDGSDDDATKVGAVMTGTGVVHRISGTFAPTNRVLYDAAQNDADDRMHTIHDNLAHHQDIGRGVQSSAPNGDDDMQQHLANHEALTHGIMVARMRQTASLGSGALQWGDTMSPTSPVRAQNVVFSGTNLARTRNEGGGYMHSIVSPEAGSSARAHRNTAFSSESTPRACPPSPQHYVVFSDTNLARAGGAGSEHVVSIVSPQAGSSAGARARIENLHLPRESVPSSLISELTAITAAASNLPLPSPPDLTSEEVQQVFGMPL